MDDARTFKTSQFKVKAIFYTYNIIWKRNNHFEHRAPFPHPTPPPRGAILQFARGRQNPVLGLHPGGMPSWIRHWCLCITTIGLFQKLTEHRKGSIWFSKSPPLGGRFSLSSIMLTWNYGMLKLRYVIKLSSLVGRTGTTAGWFAGKCLISGPDTLRSYKHENRNGAKFFSLDLYSLRSYS